MAKAKYKQGADGYYRTRIWDGTYNPDGTKHRAHLSSDKSSSDLEKKVNALKKDVAERNYVQPSTVLLVDYARHWLSTYKSVREAKTQEMYKRIIETHISRMGPLKLQEVRHLHLQRLINETSDRPRTCQQIKLTFKQIIKAAVKDRLLPRTAVGDICEDIDLPKYIKREKRALTATEREAIKRADFTDRERCYIYLIYGCGLRREEAVAIVPGDIDREQKTVRVRRAITFVNNKPILKTLKTDNGRRDLPIPDFLFDFLIRFTKKMKSDEYLIQKIGGGTITKSSYNKMWESILRKMNAVLEEGEVIEGLTAHVFRHNYCTQLCYQIPKISIKKIAYLLGDTEQMVIDVYTHVLEEKESVQEAIESAIFL